jgi:hypothetical protein
MRCNSKFPSKPPQNFELKRVVERLIARCTSPFCSVRPPAYPSVSFNVRECTHALTCFVHIQLRFYACAHSDKSAVANVQHAHTTSPTRFVIVVCVGCYCGRGRWVNARARARTHTHTQWTGTLGEFVELHEPRCDQIEVSCPKTGCTWTGRHCVCCVCCVCVCVCVTR